MKRTTLWFNSAVILAALLVLTLIFLGSGKVHSQQAQPTPKKVNQHWKIVNCAPVDLQHELEVLNAVGISVTKDQIIVVGDKFTIMVSDPDTEEDDQGK